MDFLSGLQSKSSQVKTTYAFVFSGVITGIIALVWVSTIPARFSDVPQKEETHRGMFSVLSGKVKTQLAAVVGTEPESPEVHIPSIAELPTEAEVLAETINEETYASSTSALSTLTVSNASPTTTTEQRVDQPLPVPTPELLPQATYEEARAQNRVASGTSESVIKEDGTPKPIIIEAKPIQQRTILIGTSTVQKAE